MTEEQRQSKIIDIRNAIKDYTRLAVEERDSGNMEKYLTYSLHVQSLYLMKELFNSVITNG